MIERHVAAQQVERFAGLDWYPRDTPALRELVTAMQACPNEMVAAYIADEWLARQRECPKPADLRALAHIEGERFRSDHPPAPCHICQGTGFLIVERGGLTGAKDCECRAKFRGTSAPAGEELPEGSIEASIARLAQRNRL